MLAVLSLLEKQTEEETLKLQLLRKAANVLVLMN